MMKHKRIFCSLLALLLLSASCGTSQTDVQGGEDTTSGSGETTPAETTAPGLISKLTPELKEELGLEGYEFNVFLRQANMDWTLEDIVATEETGDILNDATYKRNLWLEENYGFTLKAGNSADTYAKEMINFILADDDTYDAYFPMASTAGTAAAQGLLYNLYDLKYLDFDNSCWNKMFSESLEIDGKLFYATGAISTNSYDSVRLFFVNKTLLEENKLDNPYALVREGKWTFDKFNEMASKASADLNGDTERKLEDDQFGMGWQYSQGGLPFFYGAGELITKMDDNGLPVLNLESERVTDIYTKIRDTIANHDIYITGNDDPVFQMFHEGRSLFFTEVLDCAKRLRPYDVDFGILPIPKWTEDQDEYVQFVDAWCLSPVVVAKNNTNLDRTGFIIQALAEASKQFLVEPYYETVLEGKALRDEESIEMLEICINNFVLDNCDMYSWGRMNKLVLNGMAEGQDLASIVAANKSAVEAAIAKTLENIKD